MKSLRLFFCSVFLLLLFNSCKKEAGKGGTSFIRGKVYAKYYNKTFTILSDSAYAPNVNVYIIYGDQYAFGDHQSTGYDGTYEFRYLEKGSYKVYALSRDSTGTYNGTVNQWAAKLAVIKDVEITKNKQTVVVPDINTIQ